MDRPTSRPGATIRVPVERDVEGTTLRTLSRKVARSLSWAHRFSQWRRLSAALSRGSCRPRNSWIWASSFWMRRRDDSARAVTG
ncbi:hypothetical protein [Streptomyces sp. NPDC056144]|uniref:hypothetical protein n=1 Tax=unclassified Streptomyces TaxID=2593676 RepID=UPI0035D9FA15